MQVLDSIMKPMNDHFDQFLLPKSVWPVDWGKENNMYFYLEEIEELKEGRVKVKNRGEMIMLSSYSYLGLLGHPAINEAAIEAIKKYGTGTHGVRLLAGTTSMHHELEHKIAEFKKSESAIVYPNGYITNVSTIASLLGRNDVVICDKFNHASIVDGCQLAGADFLRYKHNDMNHLEECLRKVACAKNKLVVVDAVFSMDGDVADVPSISFLCRKYGALFMVDEAHSIGVLGNTGHGVEEHFNLDSESIDLKMGTLSKAIPAMGGYVAASETLVQFLKHNSRGFIFSAALALPLVAASLKSFDIIVSEPERIQKLNFNTTYFRNKLKEKGFDLLNAETPINPVICGEDVKAWEMAKYCQDRGLFVHAIPSPVVPKGQARLRAIVTASHSVEDINYSIDIISEAGRRTGIINEIRDDNYTRE